ncbi:hypothetical protein T484DRAFT_1910152 [Baffinella frigidus]|nr:hypothetical protein T484DRAFT_1910152 [Cryptophyta sp. CCMP2293]
MATLDATAVLVAEILAASLKIREDYDEQVDHDQEAAGLLSHLSATEPQLLALKASILAPSPSSLTEPQVSALKRLHKAVQDVAEEMRKRFKSRPAQQEPDEEARPRTSRSLRVTSFTRARDAIPARVCVVA